jgi:hypothetical protein
LEDSINLDKVTMEEEVDYFHKTTLLATNEVVSAEPSEAKLPMAEVEAFTEARVTAARSVKTKNIADTFD